MSQIQLFGSGGNTPVANIETLSAESGAPFGPLGNNFHFTGSVAGGAAANGAILFNIPSIGEMEAIVQTDGVSIHINASNQLEVIPGLYAAKFAVDAFTGPGTNPVVPDVTGQITVTGGQTAPGTIANVIQTNSLAANAWTTQIQQTSAVAAKDTTKNGVSHFNSAQFTNDQGFISIAGGYSGTVTTNGLETKTVLTIPTLNNSVSTVEARISGFGTPIGPGVIAGLGGTMTVSFITGTIATTAIDVPDTFIQSFVSSTATFTATNSGTDIIITVTGDAAYDINWKCEANVTEVT